MTKRNRGKHSNDDKSFAPKWLPIFKDAVDDLCHLLTRGYAESSALQLVGNRYKLNKRQRNALLRMSVSNQNCESRSKTEILSEKLKGKHLEIDGFNLLILLESALSGAYLFKARDGLYRDISSVHGAYRRVIKTEEAILLIGRTLHELGVSSVKWYLDQPVSNSGRMKQRLLEIAEQDQFNWEAELVFDPDKVLAKSKHIVISSDGWILDEAKYWFNLGAHIIENKLEQSNLIAI